MDKAYVFIDSNNQAHWVSTELKCPTAKIAIDPLMQYVYTLDSDGDETGEYTLHKAPWLQRASQSVNWDPTDFIGYTDEQVKMFEHGFRWALNKLYNKGL